MKYSGMVVMAVAMLVFVPGLAAQTTRPGADAAKVAQVAAGNRTEANAAWWGFDSHDATTALERAIQSKADKVIVPDMGKPWIVSKTIKLRSNLEIVFEPGVEVVAKAGAFRGKSDSLFAAENMDHIVLRGNGAVLRMRKQDYMKPPYEKGEWRHVLRFVGCRNVQVLGLTLRDSGGDGLYLGGGARPRPACEDVVVRDVVCDNNLRQGISITGGKNVLIENCVLKNTAGTAPGAGIDLEPSQAYRPLINVVVRNCVAENNAGGGFMVYVRKLGKDQNLSILFDHCRVRGGGQGLVVGAVSDEGPGGLVDFRNCLVENTSGAGAYVYDKSSLGALVRFDHCTFDNVAGGNEQELAPEDAKSQMIRELPSAPLLIYLRRPSITRHFGGVEFIQCQVDDERNRPFLLAAEKESDLGVEDLRGSIRVIDPGKARMELGAKARNIDLKVMK